MPKTILKNLFLSLLVALFLTAVGEAQSRSYTVQIASAESEAEARAIISGLKSKGIEAYWVKAEVPGKGTRYRVRIGKFKTQAKAKGVAEQAISQNLIQEFIITPYETPTSGPATPDSIVLGETKTKPEPDASSEKTSDKRSNSRSDKSDTLNIENIEKTKIAKENTGDPVFSPVFSKDRPKTVAPATQPPPPTTASTISTAAPKASAQTKTAKNSGYDDDAKAGTPLPTAEPAITTPAVAAANADITINNDNWKIVRRSVETDKNLRSIYFVDAMTGWAAGDAGTVYRTTDGGRAWKPLLSGAPANINFIHFIDWNNGWMLGDSSGGDDESESILFITTNGGKTWTRKSMPNLLSLYFIDPKNGWAVGKNATLLKTSDGGNEWKKTNSMEMLIGLPVESTSYNYGFRDIQFVDALHGWLIGNFYGRARNNIGGIFMTTDGGTTWKRMPVTIQTQFSSGRFTPGVFHSVKFTDLNTGSVTGEMYDGEGRFFFVLHTRDGGKTWEQFRIPSRATHSTQFLDLSNGWMAAFAPREGAAEAVVYDTTLMRTDNGGMSWRNDFTAKGRRIRGVFFLSPTKGWAVGDRGMILRYEEKTKVN